MIDTTYVPTSITILSLPLFAVYLVVPIWAIISACRNLRGAFLIFRRVIIIGSSLFISENGHTLSTMFLAFKKRVVAVQRSTVMR